MQKILRKVLLIANYYLRYWIWAGPMARAQHEWTSRNGG